MSNSVVCVAGSVVNVSLVEKSVNDFKIFAKQTAIGILEMGRVVFEAKETLEAEGDFEVFCERVGYKSTSSSIKKLKLIGEKYLQLKEHSACLPNNWTSLYQISRLAQTQLIDFINRGLIHQNVKGVEIEYLLKGDSAKATVLDGSSTEKASVPNGTQPSLRFECQIDAVNDLHFTIKLQKVLRELESLNVKVDLSPDLKEALRPLLEIAA